MSMYEKLDALILARISRGPVSFAVLHAGDVRVECDRIGDDTRRQSYRVLDARLQALRKKGLIRYGAKDGWSIAEEVKASLTAQRDELLSALQALVFAARTSGGTAGRDDYLVTACDVAETAIAKATKEPT